MDQGEKTIVMRADQLRQLLDNCRNPDERPTKIPGAKPPKPSSDERQTRRPPPGELHYVVLSSLPPLELDDDESLILEEAEIEIIEE